MAIEYEDAVGTETFYWRQVMLNVDLKQNSTYSSGKGIWEPGYLDLIPSCPATNLEEVNSLSYEFITLP